MEGRSFNCRRVSELKILTSQVISSIEQKTEGSEKKQQLAKEYREKVRSG